MREKTCSRSESNIAAFGILQTSPSSSREVINETLTKWGMRPIALRSYQHLTRLLKSGVIEYMTINAFDQWKKKQRGESPGVPVIPTQPSADFHDVVESCATTAADTAKKMGLSDLVARVFYEQVKKAHEGPKS